MNKTGPLQKREAKQALLFLSPTVFIVLSVIAFPLLANFWISVKPVTLGDLRPPAAVVREQIAEQNGAAAAAVRYRIRNSSKKAALQNIIIRDVLPENAAATGEHCQAENKIIICKLPELPPGGRTTLLLTVQLQNAADLAAELTRQLKNSKPQSESESDSVLFSSELTLDNFRALFNADEFWRVVRVSLLYAFFGTGGALFLGLLAALWLLHPFRGRAAWRGLMLFPYVAPVIAVAFTWLVLFDPFSGAVNALLVRSEITEAPINFFGTRAAKFQLFGATFNFPLALASVIAFECWRYFPLAFLFILARMQSLNPDLDDAADMDGASPLQKFRHIMLPQLAGVMSVMFLLRFIWTFNKFDDIFLLTGGAGGTRTLVVNVYEQAFAVSNIGAGAAAAAVVFAVLLLCCAVYFRFAPKGEGW